MITMLFGAILLGSMAVALTNWRHGWFAAVVCGILQDPVRKMTPGAPAALTMSIVAVYAVILFGAYNALQRNRADFARRFPNLYSTIMVFVLVLAFAGLNGLATFGLAAWQAPLLSFLIYLLPLPAILLGYAWLTREDQLIRFLQFYAIITSAAMIGTVLEYLRVRHPALGMVSMPWGFIRHLPGIEIRILSGFYRAPDIMGWHAATLTMIGITLAVRSRALSKAWPWIAIAAWGFANCMLSGRRKAIYMVALFALAFLWRYMRRMNMAQIALVALAGVALAFVVREIRSSSETEVYARGARTTPNEVLQRLEGGFFGTLEQNSLLGAGLGAATQGVRHVTGLESDFGWQEGGLGKLTAELGLQGVLVAAMLAWAVLRMMIRITAVGDIPGTSQLVRAALFGIVVANIGNFLASAQAYSDPVLTLMTAFFAGCLFATATLDERLAQTETVVLAA
ncbi:MAG TPA: hypothetical protein VM733_19050, partial [Thermoanaerobaculia bacterium]|nr:hypothetical protein [Thermoanaerobaculia bacterium]